jgi:hypothetical protein
MRHLLQSADSSNYFIRSLFVDFRGVFDLIDHRVMLKKFLELEIPKHVVVWCLDFINNHSHFVKIGESVSSIVKMMLVHQKVQFVIQTTSNCSSKT